jgi:2-haloalkanoic acid dehalogenase type II
MEHRLLDYDALSFDCYGTLIDWESGIWNALQPLIAANRADADRTELLAEYAKQEVAQEKATPSMPYSELLTLVHHNLAGALGLATGENLDRRFGESVPEWPAFPDSPQALRRLAERYRLVILSNVDRRSFAGSNRLLEVTFDAVYTAEDIGSYKPDPANFDYLISHVEKDLGVRADNLLHVAQSLFHDHAPAKAAGLDTVWIDRQRLSEGGHWGATLQVDDWPKPDHVFYSMAELAEAVEGA